VINSAKRIELLANIAIIVVALLLGAVLVKKYMFPSEQATASPDLRIQRGTQLSIPGVDWAQSNQTLLLVVSDTCHFCTDSADFYRRLVQERSAKGGPRLIAVLPQDVDKGKAYVDKLGVAVDGVKQSSLSAIGVKATPTLILVDRAGKTINSWVGQLREDKEAEVLSRFKTEQASN
jgi:hypothetical protein